MASRGLEDPRKTRVSGLRFFTWNAIADRGGVEAEGVAASGARRGRREGARSWRCRSTRHRPRDFSGIADARASHAQANADRSASLQRNRERVLRRDSASGEAIAGADVDESD